MASYKDPESKKWKSAAKLIKVHEITRSLKSMFNTMDKEATGPNANFDATMTHVSKWPKYLLFIRI